MLQHFDLRKALADLEERKRAKAKEAAETPSSGPTSETQGPTSQPPSSQTPRSAELTTPTTPHSAFSVGGEEDEEEEEDEFHEQRPLSEKARGKLPEGVEVPPQRESTFGLRSSPGLNSPVPERREFHPTDSWVPPTPVNPPFSFV